jgi:GNAT superfamily N-acetyltransferase
MKVDIIEEPTSDLAGYGQVAIAFEVRSVLDVVAAADDDRYELSERVVDIPYMKDYDAADGERPTEWPTRFDVSHWGFWAAMQRGRRVGGAAIAFRTPGLSMLEDRQDLAVLWDIRVAPHVRRQGVGSFLLGAVERWAETTCRAAQSRDPEHQSNPNYAFAHDQFAWRWRSQDGSMNHSGKQARGGVGPPVPAGAGRCHHSAHVPEEPPGGQGIGQKGGGA